MLPWWERLDLVLGWFEAAATIAALAAAAWWFYRRRIGEPRANLRQRVEIRRADGGSAVVWVSLEVENIGQVGFCIETVQSFYLPIKPLPPAVAEVLGQKPYGMFDEKFLEDAENEWRSLARAVHSPTDCEIHPGETDSFAAVLAFAAKAGDSGCVVSQVKRAGGGLAWRTRTIIDV